MEDLRKLEEFPGYAINAMGEVFSLNYRGERGKVSKLKGGYNSKGYHYINFMKGGVKIQRAVHRLVATVFVSNPDGKLEVNHKDGNKRNNRADNLEWCNHGENVKHAFDTGLMNPAILALKRSKLSLGQIEEAAKMRISGMSYDDIGKHFGCSGNCVNNSINGRQGALRWSNRL